MNTFVDRRGDVAPGDLDGVGYGPHGATSHGAAAQAGLAARPKTAPASNPFTGTVMGGSPLLLGLVLFGGLLLVAKMRKVL